MKLGYETDLGQMFLGRTEDLFPTKVGEELGGSVQLILTSPPFPLNRKKRYGNAEGDEYVDWLKGFAGEFRRLLTSNGSIVLEMGNAWEPGQPTQSTLSLEALLAFLECGGFHLCQEFIWYNPARLPTPVEWVNKRRIRVKDSFTRLWWMSPSTNPQADNRAVLKPYSESMKRLLKRGTYHSGERPSEHVIGSKSFLKDNGGAIPPNVLCIANTGNRDKYHHYCEHIGVTPHPARMPQDLVEFFVRFLTTEGDLVMDPFAGSNTTGEVAEALSRRWVCVEPVEEYVLGSMGRFPVLQGEGRAHLG